MGATITDYSSLHDVAWMEGVARIGGCALAVVRDYSGATRLAVREDYRLAGLGGVRGLGLARLAYILEQGWEEVRGLHTSRVGGVQELQNSGAWRGAREHTAAMPLIGAFFLAGNTKYTLQLPDSPAVTSQPRQDHDDGISASWPIFSPPLPSRQCPPRRKSPPRRRTSSLDSLLSGLLLLVAPASSVVPCEKYSTIQEKPENHPDFAILNLDGDEKNVTGSDSQVACQHLDRV
eukprot:scaffold63285_cov38-Attheya_sp.AAC.1